MRKVLDRLYVGGTQDVLTVEGVETIKSLGIKYILNVAEEVVYKYPIPDVEVKKVGLVDGRPVPVDDLKEAINFIGKSISKGPCLVHCSGGLSRSPSIIIAYLVRVGFSYPAALRLVEGGEVGRSSLVTPAPVLLDSIRTYFGDLWGT